MMAACSHCRNVSVWNINGKEMIHPVRTTAPLPAEDMPDDVRLDYEEAAKIFNSSPRGAAALLRLGLQKLCKHLSEPGKHIDKDIRSLAEKNVLSQGVIRVADTMRITGNNAVHPGEMSDEAKDAAARKKAGQAAN